MLTTLTRFRRTCTFMAHKLSRTKTAIQTSPSLMQCVSNATHWEWHHRLGIDAAAIRGAAERA